MKWKGVRGLSTALVGLNTEMTTFKTAMETAFGVANGDGPLAAYNN